MWLVVVVGELRWLLVWQSGSRCCDQRHSVLVCVQVIGCVKSVWLLCEKGARFLGAPVVGWWCCVRTQ